MTQLHQSRATLRLIGDNLDPDEITRLLGATPTAARKKDAIWRTPNGREVIARTGMWRLLAADREPEDLDGQVVEILGKLTDDLGIWADLAHRFRLELFCGWFMAGSNEGVGISPKALAALAARGIALELDIYDNSLAPRGAPSDKTATGEWEGKIRLAIKADAQAWLTMRTALWPDANTDDLQLEVGRYFVAHGEPLLPHRVFVAEKDGAIVGMLELSLRPYADGCASSPVPFIEGWYVVPEARRRGVGRALVRAAEEWAVAHGYSEMASDALLDNQASHHAHAAGGFEEVERAIRFRKSLKR